MEDIGFIKKWKEGLGMAKRFRRVQGTKIGKKEHIKSEEEIAAEKAAQEAKKIADEKMQEEKNKMKFLETKGLQARPNSQMAIKAWEEYKAK